MLEGLESANAYSTVSLDAPDSGDEDAPAVVGRITYVTTGSDVVAQRQTTGPGGWQIEPSFIQPTSTPATS